MPNHVFNTLYFDYHPHTEEGHEKTRTDFEQLKELMQTEESAFDFNAVIPTPDTVFQEPVGRDWQPSGKYTTDWYTWSIEHWGTKWNAYDIVFDGDAISFLTAWTCPAPVVAAISRRFPNSRVVLEYAEEHEVGKRYHVLMYRNGHVIEMRNERVRTRPCRDEGGSTKKDQA